MKTIGLYFLPVLAVLYQPTAILCIRKVIHLGYKTHQLSPDGVWIASVLVLALSGVVGMTLGLLGTYLLLSGKSPRLSAIPFVLFYVPAMLAGGFYLAILFMFLPLL